MVKHICDSCGKDITHTINYKLSGPASATELIAYAMSGSSSTLTENEVCSMACLEKKLEEMVVVESGMQFRRGIQSISFEGDNATDLLNLLTQKHVSRKI